MASTSSSIPLDQEEPRKNTPPLDINSREIDIVDLIPPHTPSRPSLRQRRQNVVDGRSEKTPSEAEVMACRRLFVDKEFPRERENDGDAAIEKKIEKAKGSDKENFHEYEEGTIPESDTGKSESNEQTTSNESQNNAEQRSERIPRRSLYTLKSRRTQRNAVSILFPSTRPPPTLFFENEPPPSSLPAAPPVAPNASVLSSPMSYRSTLALLASSSRSGDKVSATVQASGPSLLGYQLVCIEDGSIIRGFWKRKIEKGDDGEGGEEEILGIGVREWTDGSRYEGEFVGFIAHGHGTLHGLHEMGSAISFYFLFFTFL